MILTVAALGGCTGHRMELPLRLVGPADVREDHRWSEWAAMQGGMDFDATRALRADRAAYRVTLGRLPVFVHVLNNKSVTAYSYSDGHVFITRGLMDAATDDELAAAIAHELGHLLADGHLPGSRVLTNFSPASVRGETADREVQADRVGVALMRARRIPADSLKSLLEKVAAATNSDSTRTAVLSRANLLQ